MSVTIERASASSSETTWTPGKPSDDEMIATSSSPDRVYLPFAAPRPTRDLCVARSAFRYRTNAARAFVGLLKTLLAQRRLAPPGRRGFPA